MKKLLPVLFSILSISAFSQKLTLEAVYSNNKNEPYRIERKYEGESKLYYVVHYNQGSRCLAEETYKKGDSLIVEETIYDVVQYTPQDRLTMADGFVVNPFDSGDTKTYSLFSFEKNLELGDTILPSDYDSEYFLWGLREMRLKKILENKIQVPIDSLTYKEKTIIYYLNELPVKIEFFGHDKTNHLSMYGEVNSNSLICKWFKNYPTKKYFRFDTISWNSDSTELNVILHRFAWDKMHSHHSIQNNKQLVISTDEHQDTLNYLERSNIFRDRIVEILVYTDFPYTFDLKFNYDRHKLVERKNDYGYHKIGKYSFDENGKIIGKNIFINDSIQSHVEYQYFEKE